MIIACKNQTPVLTMSSTKCPVCGSRHVKYIWPVWYSLGHFAFLCPPVVLYTYQWLVVFAPRLFVVIVFCIVMHYNWILSKRRTINVKFKSSFYEKLVRFFGKTLIKVSCKKFYQSGLGQDNSKRLKKKFKSRKILLLEYKITQEITSEYTFRIIKNWIYF